MISLAAKNSGNKDAAIGEIYGLDHGRLNVEMPPKSMWMNMGYWRVCDFVFFNSFHVMMFRRGIF
jgi:hypothetical protein